MTRVAGIDIGTNTTRLLVADVRCAALLELERRVQITRLGENVAARRRLLPGAVARTRAALAEFAACAQALGAERVLAAATSAVREAEDGGAFLADVGSSFGFATRLLTGEEEAELTFRGVTSGRDARPGTLVVDPGGGSTELVLGGPDGVEQRVSVDVGAVRLTERFLHSDPPLPSELEACAASVRAELGTHVPASMRARAGTAVGVAGTVTTLAAIELGRYDRELVHGARVGADVVERELRRLATLPLAERERVRGLELARAPVIVAGVVIVRETLAHFGLQGLEVSEHDLLDGIVLAAADLASAELPSSG